MFPQRGDESMEPRVLAAQLFGDGPGSHGAKLRTKCLAEVGELLGRLVVIGCRAHFYQVLDVRDGLAPVGGDAGQPLAPRGRASPLRPLELPVAHGSRGCA